MLEPTVGLTETEQEPRYQEVPDSALPEDMGSSHCRGPTECSTPPSRTSTPVPVEPAALCNPTYPQPFSFAKRSRASDVAGSIRDMQASDERRQERDEERLDRRLQVAREEALQDAIDTRQYAGEQARQQMVQVAAFNAAFLQTISQMVQGFAHHDPVL